MRSDRSRGFSLLESMVTLVILSIVMIGLLTLLDSANKLAKQENQVADAQAGSRAGAYEIARALRSVRTGQLSPIVAVRPFANNAGSGVTLTSTGGTAHTIREGTDAIEIRGVLYSDDYYFQVGDLLCGGTACRGMLTGSTTVSITIRQTFPTGQRNPATGEEVMVTNYPAGSRPEFATRNDPFFFVVATTQYQNANPSDPTTPFVTQYVVGRVDVPSPPVSPPAWYSQPGDFSSFTFTMTVDPSSTGMMELMARTSGMPIPAPQKPLMGGVLDDVVFFVDRGPQDALAGNAYAQPFLAQAVRSAQNPNQWVVQPLVDEVEDLQFAFGVDGADGSFPDRGVDPRIQSTTANGDEWVLNVAGEESNSPPSGKVTLAAAQTLYPQFIMTGVAPALAVPTLKAISIGIVSKSADPSVGYEGPGAKGVKIYDSTAAPAMTTRSYRRRVQTMAVNLRNYQ